MPSFTNTRFKSENVNGGFLYMRATGIVRRIDDLGRVVIPKEIRRTLRIRESEPLEIFTGKEGEIVSLYSRKHSQRKSIDSIWHWI